MIANVPLLQKHRLKVRKRAREIVATWFAAELDQLAPASRTKWLTAIATLVGDAPVPCTADLGGKAPVRRAKRRVHEPPVNAPDAL